MNHKFPIEILKFCAVGLVNTLVTLTTIFFMGVFGFSAVISNAVGYTFGVATSFFLNKNWTFVGGRLTYFKICKFILAVCTCYLTNLVVLLAMLPRFPTFIAQVSGVCVYSVLFFCSLRYFVFFEDRRRH